MIFCLYGTFLENSLPKQNFPSPHVLAVCMQEEGESLSFFLRLAALCMVFLDDLKSCLEHARKVLHFRYMNENPSSSSSKILCDEFIWEIWHISETGLDCSKLTYNTCNSTNRGSKN